MYHERLLLSGQDSTVKRSQYEIREGLAFARELRSGDAAAGSTRTLTYFGVVLDRKERTAAVWHVYSN
jgi:hypothetical protein